MQMRCSADCVIMPHTTCVFRTPRLLDRATLRFFRSPIYNAFDFGVRSMLLLYLCGYSRTPTPSKINYTTCTRHNY